MILCISALFEGKFSAQGLHFSTSTALLMADCVSPNSSLTTVLVIPISLTTE